MSATATATLSDTLVVGRQPQQPDYNHVYGHPPPQPHPAHNHPNHTNHNLPNHNHTTAHSRSHSHSHITQQQTQQVVGSLHYALPSQQTQPPPSQDPRRTAIGLASQQQQLSVPPLPPTSQQTQQQQQPTSNDPGPSAQQVQQDLGTGGGQPGSTGSSIMYRPPSSASPNVIASPSRGPGKRKQSDAMPGDDKTGKKRRGSQYNHGHAQDHVSGGGGASEDLLGGVVDNPGAKHWSDEEKTKFFAWLLGSDEHWEQFGTKMNTCFRECAQALFNNRKTFTALKSCYHRNLDTFKQLATFEQFNGQFETGMVDPTNQNERQTHFEKRLEAARAAGCSIGNLSPRIVDNWIKNGWYDLFRNRFYTDANRSMPVMPSGQGATREHEPPPQASEPGPSVQVQVPDPRSSEPPSHCDPHVDHLQPPPQSPPIRQAHHEMLESSPIPTYHHPPHPAQPPTQPLNQLVVAGSSSMVGIEQTVAHLTGLTQTLIASYAHMVQSQSEDNRAKMEFLKRRDEREQEDSRLRREMERRREDREIAELERIRERENVKQKTDLATELVSNPNVDLGVKEAAADFLKKLFQY